MQHAQHKENDFLVAGCVRIEREEKKIEEERKEEKLARHMATICC